MTDLIQFGQAGDSVFFQHLDLCCQKVAEKLGDGNISGWTNSDYIRLSRMLQRETKIHLSENTLKRIFGKVKTPERYHPQKATRDALALYIGFADWETFVREHPRPAMREENDISQTGKKVKVKIAQKKRTLLFVIVSIIGIAGLTVWQFMIKENPVAVNTGGVKFICNNPEGENPHSASFLIRLPENFPGDISGFTVDYGDSKRERKVTAGKVFTHYFEIPGRYYPVLKYNSIPIDTVFVYLKTSGWSATADMEHDTTRVYPISNANLFKDGGIKINSKELHYAGVDTSRTFYVNFVNTRPLNINGDNFELRANVNASQIRPGVRCSQVNVEVYGEKTKHTILFMKPGCVSWSVLRVSEITKDGELEDLSSLGADFTNGGTLKLKVADKHLTIFINEKPVYEISYKVPLKKIYGVKIAFSGIGTLNDLVLKDIGTGEVFDDGI